MALDPSNSSSLEQLALKGLSDVSLVEDKTVTIYQCARCQK